MLPLPLPQMQGPQLAPPNPHPHLPPKLILKLKIASWNVCGWANGLGGNFRESVIRALDLDIICLCETFLVGDEGINIEGFRWIGNNRKILSRRALRGSGGVGVLIRNLLAEDYSIFLF